MQFWAINEGSFERVLSLSEVRDDTIWENDRNCFFESIDMKK